MQFLQTMQKKGAAQTNVARQSLNFSSEKASAATGGVPLAKIRSALERHECFSRRLSNKAVSGEGVYRHIRAQLP